MNPDATGHRLKMCHMVSQRSAYSAYCPLVLSNSSEPYTPSSRSSDAMLSQAGTNHAWRQTLLVRGGWPTAEELLCTAVWVMSEGSGSQVSRIVTF